MRWNTYIARKILEIGGYGMLYNWFCTQQQAAVEYGYLYNWYAATDSRNITSTGWHIPTRTEMETLRTYLGGTSIAGGKLKEVGTTYWQTPNVGATNESKFNLIAAGYRLDTDGSFANIYTDTRLMTTFESGSLFRFGSCFFNDSIFNMAYINKKQGVSIRPIKDSTTLTHGQTGIYIDPSGIIYPTICIGTQEWVACNIITKHYRNGDAIPEVTSNTAWAALTTGARCSYNNTEANAGTTKKISSSDSFIVPSSSIYYSLSAYLGGDYFSGGKLKETGTTHWLVPNIGATNEVGFTATGGGARSSDGSFGDLKYSGSYWCSNELNYLSLVSYTQDILIGPADNERYAVNIRLCNPTTLNAEGSINSYIQNDGTVIPTIVINGVEWTMNLKETKWSDGSDIQNITDNTAWSLLQEAACCDINNDPTKR